MERCRIRMKMDLQIPAQLPYDKTDICALYANALDNAMEACMKLDETQREICLKCRAGKGLFCLEVSNPLQENRIPSTQKGKPLPVQTSRRNTACFSSLPNQIKQIMVMASKVYRILSQDIKAIWKSRPKMAFLTCFYIFLC